MGFIRAAEDGWHFEDADTGRPFVPIGANYCAVMARVDAGGYCGNVFPLFGTDEHTAGDGVAEGRRAFERLESLGLNIVRIWLEPHDFFPVGRRLDPAGAAKLDALLDAGRRHGIRFTIGMHLCDHASGHKFQPFEPPHGERLLDQLHTLAGRWGRDEQIFSWTIVGEGTLPWQTPWIVSQWPAWLQYWYNDDLDTLRKAWGSGMKVPSFADAPVPPPNVGLTVPLGTLRPSAIAEFPPDPWAGSTWRYDWRLFIEEIGSARVRREARTLREAGARQMITVGNNCWTFPGLPATQMARGYDPYFYLDAVDYLCQHNYPAPQCLPGATGDPLDNEESMQFWLNACEIIGRIYGSLGKPVIMEEWGWYGGGASSFLCPLPHRSEDDQRRYGDRMMEVTQHCFAGWLNWLWRDMPRASDISNLSGLFAADGNRLKPWGRSFTEWARKLKAAPPVRAAARATLDMPMKDLYTSDTAHEQWWQSVCHDYEKKGPFDFRPVFERKPMTSIMDDDLRGTVSKVRRAIETPMGQVKK